MLAFSRKLISYASIAAGALLLLQGVRVLFDWHIGQADAANQFLNQQIDSDPSETSAPGYALAKLTIPRLGTELYVFEGDGVHDLSRGPGHLSGTALPGSRGNCVIAGHRDTHFHVLMEIREGDDIVLQTRDAEYHYRVKRTKVVAPENMSSLQPTSDAELNLITCYPFTYLGTAPQRFIVEALLDGQPAARIVE
jgi:sortase A